MEPVFEHFGPERSWAHVGAQFKLTQDPSTRVQIRNASDNRMIQAQNGRLHYNWLWQTGEEYPRYTEVRPEFDRTLERFLAFLREESLEEPQMNQWEVTYINHLPKGSVWSEPADWTELFASLAGPCKRTTAAAIESFGGQWHYEIKPRRGRLHVDIRHGRRTTTDDCVILVMTLTARGSVDTEPGDKFTLDSGLNLGRETIVRTFTELTSEKAHEYWGAL